MDLEDEQAREREEEEEREREREREREDAATFGMRLAQGAGRWGEGVSGAGAASTGDENEENVSDIQGELETMRKKLCVRAWMYVCSFSSRLILLVELQLSFGATPLTGMKRHWYV